MKANGKKLKRLTRNKAADGDAVYSPSGRKIAFIRGEKRAAELWTMNANGSGKRRLTNNSFADASPAWSPDGRRIVFRSSRVIAPDVEPNLDIWVINADGTGETRLTSAGTRRRRRSGLLSRRHQDRVSLVARYSVRHLRHERRRHEPVAGGPKHDGRVRRGLVTERREARVRDPTAAGNSEIYVMNADGTGEKRVTRTSRANEALPVFSPDGSRIAFQRRLISASGAITRADDVFVMRSGGKGVKRLTRSRDYDGRPDWQAR